MNLNYFLAISSLLGFIVFFLLYVFTGTVSLSEWDVAFGTSFLATATFLAFIITEERNDKSREKEINQRRLNEFYSPLIKILSADPEPIKGIRSVIKERANETVSILRGKRYLATIDTVNKIPEDVEKVAFVNWLKENDTVEDTDRFSLKPIIGYLVFETEDHKEAWLQFANQLWKDYDKIVKEFYSDQQEQDKEPDWKFTVKS